MSRSNLLFNMLRNIAIIVSDYEDAKNFYVNRMSGSDPMKYPRKEVEDLIGAGTTKAFRLLKELCEAGKLEQKGNGRLSTYVTK